MKTLELNQMEILHGGDDFACTVDTVTAVLGFIGIALVLASNPIGWVAGISAGITILGGGMSGASLIANGNCF